MAHVVDTNVPVVANGKNTHASLDCRLASIEFLRSLVESGRAVLDISGAIQTEYRTYLNAAGQPGVGDRFYQMILNSSPDKVLRVDIPIDPATGEYVDFPATPELVDFDLSDRKFAAAARKANVPVVNAIDSDWLNHLAQLNANGIEIHFVCGCDPRDWGTHD